MVYIFTTEKSANHRIFAMGGGGGGLGGKPTQGKVKIL
jgi:hypothetical protein